MLPLPLCTDIAGKCVSQIVLFPDSTISVSSQGQRKLTTLRPGSVKDLSCFWAGAVFHFIVGFFVTLEGFGSAVVGKILKTCFE